MTTMTLVMLLIVAVESFLLGSIPCGLLLGKYVFNTDPRSGGSKSIGATNMNRTAGWKAGVLTLLLDAAKGALAVAIARIIVANFAGAEEYKMLFLTIALLFAISGHIFSPWLHFKGGKGISTGLGTSLVVFPSVAGTILLVFLIFVLISRRISVGSICAAISLPIAAAVYFSGDPMVWIPAAVAALWVVIAHRGNIVRIVKGEEPKFSFNKKKKEQTND